MTSVNENSSIRAMVVTAAVSVLSLTTTLSTGAVLYNPPLEVNVGTVSDDVMGTTTPFPKSIEKPNKTNYEAAKELFAGDMRDFTKEEAEEYQKSLKKIYKPTGVNIFDLC